MLALSWLITQQQGSASVSTFMSPRCSWRTRIARGFMVSNPHWVEARYGLNYRRLQRLHASTAARAVAPQSTMQMLMNAAQPTLNKQL
jgi:hypothetical protein